MKKGQITLFILFAILLIGIIGIFLIFKYNLASFKNEKINQNIIPVYSFVENCIKKTAEDAVYHIGQTGGYYIIPNMSIERRMSYYFYKGNAVMPSKENIEKNLGLYMDDMLFFCTKNYIDFPEFQVSQEKIKTSVKIKDRNVIFNVDYPLSIVKENKTYFLNKFSADIPIRLGIIYNAASKIIEKQKENPKQVCLSCVFRYTNESNLYADLADYDKGTIVFIIGDTNSKINGEDYLLFFVNKYE